MSSEKKKLFILIIFAILLSQITFSSSVLAKKKYQNSPAQEYKYQQKILRKLEIEKYERSLLPESGYMTKEEYEKTSEDIPNSKKIIPEPKLPKDIKMKYVPQPTYKLVKYNNPPGSPELQIIRKFYFDRQENAQGVASPDLKFLVYPSIYYYAEAQCTAGDLFVIPLDKTLPDVERISRANVIKRNPNPILSTEKDISQKFIFRTMTPIDFSPDSSKLVAKEKIGNVYDGIWKTNLWLYDFDSQKAQNLSDIRTGIEKYWKTSKNLNLAEKRWDIFPLGFDAQNPEIIVVAAYGYTGFRPVMLGVWGINYRDGKTSLISMNGSEAKIATSGVKLVQSGVINPYIVKTEEKRIDKSIKNKRKQTKHEIKKQKQEAKKELKKKLKQMKHEEKLNQNYYTKQQKNYQAAP